MYATRYGDKHNYKVAQKLNKLARSLNVSPTALSIAWVLNHPAITAPIIGGRNADQLLDSIQSLEIDMSVDLRKNISSLSIAPPNATDRNEENTEYNYGQR